MVTTKRMSAEEKRKVIMDIYHKTGEVYSEKEVLILAVKAGVSGSAVADVHQALVDEGHIEKEKIGGSNYFWSFPGIKEWKAVTRHDQTLRGIQTLRETIEQTKQKIANARSERQDEPPSTSTAASKNVDGDSGTVVSDEEGATKNAAGSTVPVTTEAHLDAGKHRSEMTRSEKLAELDRIKRRREELEKELEVQRENDPSVLADLQKQLDTTTQAAHRWTDNIFECKTYMVKKRGMDKKEANKLIGITGAFDYPSTG